MSTGARPILLNAFLRAQPDAVVADVVLMIDGHEVPSVAFAARDDAARAAAEATLKAVMLGYRVDFELLGAGDVELDGFRVASVVVASKALRVKLAGSVMIEHDSDVARAYAKAILDAVNRTVTKPDLLARMQLAAAQNA